MNTIDNHLAHNIELANMNAQYDEYAKALMADKQVLARIAKSLSAEFKDYDIPTIIECIENEPEISTVPVYPGKPPKPQTSEAIKGMNTESTIAGEGTVHFDIRFNMRTMDEQHIKLILNIEMQKEYHQSYHYEPRAIFYCARMLSEQLHTEFTAENYDGLKKVYSIWIFFDAPQKDSDTITEYFIGKKDAFGDPTDSWKHDYISIFFIRLSNKPEHRSKHQLLHMLDTLFSNKISPKTKRYILETEHHMQMTHQIEGGSNSMCNLGQGIADKAYAEGLSQGVSQGISQGVSETLLKQIRAKLKKNKSIDEIAEDLEETPERIRELMKTLDANKE